jgi:hypothetical protein
MFRTVPLSIISSFSLYTQQWYMSYSFADSLRAGSGRNVLILLAYNVHMCISVCVYIYMIHILRRMAVEKVNGKQEILSNTANNDNCRSRYSFNPYTANVENMVSS